MPEGHKGGCNNYSCSFDPKEGELITIAALIIVPIVAAFFLLFIRNDTVRTVVVVTTVALLTALSLILTVQYLFVQEGFLVPQAELISYVTLGIAVFCSLYVIYRGIRQKNYLAILFAALQCVLVIVYETGFSHGAHVATDLYIDQLSIIMALVIAIIGGSICIYALGYMRGYHLHISDGASSKGNHSAEETAPGLVNASPEKGAAASTIPDRRPVFFAMIFLFLAAMFALIFSNRLSWMLTAWEVTTLCSFVLIGYSRTEEATKNSFRAVIINLGGGIAFTVALILLAGEGYRIFELDVLIAAGVGGALVLPILLLAFAAMTKAAQMPFQRWLLGAMVAPTTVSALLHSSTMVKAGVFLLIKLAPTLGWNIPGFFVAIIGGLTFIGCSALAISQSDAKRVLAYSTIANLGLITCCAGVGTPEAVWAAIFLLIFHAAAKALLFCAVGTGQHILGTRDIESMDNIFVRLPWIATLLALGMLAMFIAPFGMLISKWAALVSIAESGHLELLIILAFGSAMTFVIWAKWLGKVLSIGSRDKRVRSKMSLSEHVSLGTMAVLIVLITLGIPLISSVLVMPYLQDTGSALHLLSWTMASTTLSYDNLIIMSIIFLMILALLAVHFFKRHSAPNDTVYMAGVGVENDERDYYNSFGKVSIAGQRNWYMERIFGEKSLGHSMTILLIVVMAFFIVLGIVAEMIVL